MMHKSNGFEAGNHLEQVGHKTTNMIVANQGKISLAHFPADDSVRL